VPSLVADTHAFVWHLVEPRRIGREARRLLALADQGRRLCYVPAIVLVEVWLLHERGRLRIGPGQMLERVSGHPGYAILPLDVEQSVEFGALPGIRDPMDRLIVAAARVTGSRLVSADQLLGGYGVEVAWD
jgi:PIN domain nuclease of toxin-antitoxin system